MKQHEVEEVANVMRECAGFGDDDLPLAVDIAERVMGPNSVVYGAPSVPARLVKNTIVVPLGHPDLNFAVAHECAHWALRELAQWKADHAQTERVANAVGAALLAPRDSVITAYRHYGEDLPTLASLFAMSQTALVLRLAEVRAESRAVVTRTGNVLARIFLIDEARSTRERSSLAREQSRAIVRAARSNRETLGLARTTLRGGIDEGRVAVLVG